MLCYSHANPNIWIYAMDKESKLVPRFYPHTFELRANRILARQLRMTRQDNNAENCESVYKFLINNIWVNEHKGMIMINKKVWVISFLGIHLEHLKVWKYTRNKLKLTSLADGRFVYRSKQLVVTCEKNLQSLSQISSSTLLSAINLNLSKSVL